MEWIQDPCLSQKRPVNAHKGTYGHALLVAGEKGKMGAALLAAAATLRSGVGLLSVHVPQRAELAFHTALPEAMLLLDDHPDRVTQPVSGLAKYSAVGMGPGLGTHPETGRAMAQMLACGDPAPRWVLDADALNLIALNVQLLDLLPEDAVLTPHPGEWERLAQALGWRIEKDRHEQILQAQRFAVEFQVVVVLKGHETAVCSPDGRIALNSTGNPGMATAGSGDVLTGFILGLLAQGLAPKEAARAGVYLHGKSGDKAARLFSQAFMSAGDIIAQWDAQWHFL